MVTLPHIVIFVSFSLSLLFSVLTHRRVLTLSCTVFRFFRSYHGYTCYCSCSCCRYSHVQKGSVPLTIALLLPSFRKKKKKHLRLSSCLLPPASFLLSVTKKHKANAKETTNKGEKKLYEVLRRHACSLLVKTKFWAKRDKEAEEKRTLRGKRERKEKWTERDKDYNKM